MSIKCIIKRKIRNFKDFFKYDTYYGIRNLRKWFKVVWNDRDWDYYYIYAVLKHKLNSMERTIRKYGHHTQSDQDADRIKLCVLLLDRLMKDNYHENAYKKHYEKWGEPQLEFIETENPELHEILVKHKYVKTEKDEKEEKLSGNRAFEHERYLQQQDLEMLFDTMKKHIRGWWD